MLGQITWKEFKEWITFESLEPFSEERQDTRFAMLAMILANSNRDPKTKPDPYEIQDFLLPFGDLPKTIANPRPQSWEEQKELGKRFASMMSKKSKRGKNGDKRR